MSWDVEFEEAVFEWLTLLVAGDKAGRWQDWYRTAIPLADDRYDSHLEALKEKPDDGGAGTGGER